MEENEIIKLLNQYSGGLFKRDISKKLNINKKVVLEQLKILEEEKKIFKSSQGKYLINDKKKNITGKLLIYQQGFGFVVPENKRMFEEDIFVAMKDLGTAMEGDVVLVTIYGKKGSHDKGKIISVLKRATTNIVGKIVVKDGVPIVIPADNNKRFSFVITNFYKELEGKIIVGNISKYPERASGEVEIVKVLGEPSSLNITSKIIEEKYKLIEFFSKNITKELSKIREKIPTDEIKRRVDIRDKQLITIDGINAKDFDDAVFVEETADGYRLIVAIADVAYYVKENSEIDKEALNRATSVYFPDKVFPMLPEKLSNNLCSLRPNEDRLVLAIEIDFSKTGVVNNYKIFEAVMKSHLRMTYEDLKDILVDKNSDKIQKYNDFYELFIKMEKLAIILSDKRKTNGSLDFDLPEPDFIFDNLGKIEDIVKSERAVSNQIIEEFMLVANKLVALYISKRKHPMLYRCHNAPDEEKMVELKEFLQIFGFHISENVKPKTFQKIIKAVNDKPHKMLIQKVILRSMSHAVYSVENFGHFGLAFKNYTHFTSPIRRYPDLVIHRILKELLRNEVSKESKNIWNEKLPKLAEHTSLKEKISEKAEREIIDFKKVEFMADKVGEQDSGIISGLSNFGFWVQLDKYFVEGFVPLRVLKDDYYVFIKKEFCIKGEHSGRKLYLGDKINVQIDRVDMEKVKIELSVVKDNNSDKPRKKKSRKKKRKKS